MGIIVFNIEIFYETMRCDGDAPDGDDHLRLAVEADGAATLCRAGAVDDDTRVAECNSAVVRAGFGAGVRTAWSKANVRAHSVAALVHSRELVLPRLLLPPLLEPMHVR